MVGILSVNGQRRCACGESATTSSSLCSQNRLTGTHILPLTSGVAYFYFDLSRTTQLREIVHQIAQHISLSTVCCISLKISSALQPAL